MTLSKSNLFSTLLISLSFATCVSTLSVRDSEDKVQSDPYADPKHDLKNPLRYITSNVLTTIALVPYLIVAVLLTLCIIRWKARYMLVLVISTFTYSIGLAMRYALHANPQSLGIYIIQNFFVVLSPCGFIAAEYVILGRLANYLEADNCLLVSPRRITAVFVTSDIFTFLIQAGGGGLSASQNASSRNIGSKLFLVGLIGQLISFATFIFLLALFLFRVRRDRPLVWMKDRQKHWRESWLTLATGIFLSCIGILIRSFFRAVEASQGYTGKLATTESFFYALDVLPLFISVTLFVPFWPGRFITLSPAPMKVPQLELDGMLSGRNNHGHYRSRA